MPRSGEQDRLPDTQGARSTLRIAAYVVIALLVLAILLLASGVFKMTPFGT